MAKKVAQKGKQTKAKVSVPKKVAKAQKAPRAGLTQAHAGKGALKGKTSAAKSAKKDKKEKKAKAEPSYSWIAQKLQDIDPYFALDHSVCFLTDLFNQLIEKKYATVSEIEKFIAETNHSVTLEQIFKHFGLKATN